MFPFSMTNVIFIGTAVALNAIVVIAYSFFNMLAANVFRTMLMAAVTGVTAVVVAYMAGDATGVVVAV